MEEKEKLENRVYRQRSEEMKRRRKRVDKDTKTMYGSLTPK